jgi:ABC-2 type transport system permease protein
VPVIVVLSLGLSGLGILVATFMRSQQGFQLAIQLLVFPLIFLAGVFFPVNSVPTWLEVLVKLNPLTYGVDAIRQIFLGEEAAAAGLGVEVFGQTMTIAADVLVVAVLGSVILSAAVWAFRRQE